MFRPLRHICLTGILAALPLAHADTFLPANWADQIIVVESKTPRIADFASSLNAVFDATQGCDAGLAEYQKTHGDAGKHSIRTGGSLTVTVDSDNGFIRCESDTYRIDYGYWQRDNGHQLIALVALWDDGKSDERRSEIYFYDFDPAGKSAALTPEPELSRTVNAWRAKDYLVFLPEKGKDLILQQHAGAGGATHYLHWNGRDFARDVSKQPAQASGKAAKPAEPKTAGKKAEPGGKNAKKSAAQNQNQNPHIPRIRDAYRNAQNAKQNGEKAIVSLRLAHTQHEDLRFYFDRAGGTPYLIEVEREDANGKYYEEYLTDTQKNPPALLFWFQKSEQGDNVRETRLYFDGADIVYHDIRETRGKNGQAANLKGDGAPPPEYTGKAAPGEYPVQRYFARLITLFDGWAGYTFPSG